MFFCHDVPNYLLVQYNLPMDRIDSPANARVKKWASLSQKKHRDSLGMFLVEGEHLCQEARQAGCLELAIMDQEGLFDFGNTVLVNEAIMRKLSSNVSQAHLIGLCRKPEARPRKQERVLLLDDVQDPGNLGTMIRTAVSFGFDGVYCSPGCADVYNEKTIRSTQGALFHIPVLRQDLETIIEDLHAQGVLVVGTCLHGAIGMSQLQEQEKMAFVLGNEGNGVNERILGLCDKRAKIEMQGFESLNVAVAAGIFMYRFRASSNGQRASGNGR